MQSLPATAGKFRLIVQLPLAEDGSKRLDEVLDDVLRALVCQAPVHTAELSPSAEDSGMVRP